VSETGETICGHNDSLSAIGTSGTLTIKKGEATFSAH